MPPSKALPGYGAGQGGGIPSAPTPWMVAHETANGKWIRLQASFEALQERLATEKPPRIVRELRRG